jgi:hypothetical protein
MNVMYISGANECYLYCTTKEKNVYKKLFH